MAHLTHNSLEHLPNGSEANTTTAPAAQPSPLAHATLTINMKISTTTAEIGTAAEASSIAISATQGTVPARAAAMVASLTAANAEEIRAELTALTESASREDLLVIAKDWCLVKETMEFKPLRLEVKKAMLQKAETKEERAKIREQILVPANHEEIQAELAAITEKASREELMEIAREWCLMVVDMELRSQRLEGEMAELRKECAQLREEKARRVAEQDAYIAELEAEKARLLEKARLRQSQSQGQ